MKNLFAITILALFAVSCRTVNIYNGCAVNSGEGPLTARIMDSADKASNTQDADLGKATDVGREAQADVSGIPGQ